MLNPMWPYNTGPTGWVCPKCQNVYAPTNMECWKCNNHTSYPNSFTPGFGPTTGGSTK